MSPFISSFLNYNIIFKENVKQYIDIRIKIFTENRKIISLERIDVNSKLNIILEKLFINDTSNNKENIRKYTLNSQFRLYSCEKGLRELNPSQTFIENEIKDNDSHDERIKCKKTI